MSEKKKILLFGDNKSLINDFFGQLSMYFEMLSCSSREEDIYGHLRYYDADALVFCIYDERREDFMILEGIKKLLAERGSLLIVAGDGSKCDEFECRQLLILWSAEAGRILRQLWACRWKPT